MFQTPIAFLPTVDLHICHAVPSHCNLSVKQLCVYTASKIFTETTAIKFILPSMSVCRTTWNAALRRGDTPRPTSLKLCTLCSRIQDQERLVKPAVKGFLFPYLRRMRTIRSQREVYIANNRSSGFMCAGTLTSPLTPNGSGLLYLPNAWSIDLHNLRVVFYLTFSPCLVIFLITPLSQHKRRS